MDKNIKDDNNSDDVNEINEELLNELDDLSQKLIITTDEHANTQHNSVNNSNNSNEIKVSNNKINANESKINDMNEPLNKAFKDLENNMAMLYETLSQTKGNNEHTHGSNSNSNPFIDNFNNNNAFPSSMSMFQHSDFAEMEKMFNMSEFSSLYDTFTKANASGDGVGANNAGVNTLLTQDEQSKIYKDTLVYLISQNLLQELISNMKMSINECLRKNKETLSNGDVQQYQKALKYAEDILNECNKANPDLDVITDVFCKLQEITELDNIQPKQ